MNGRRFLYLLVLGLCLLFFVAYLEWLSWLVLVWVIALPFASLLLSLPVMLTVRLAADVPAKLPKGTRQAVYVQTQARLPLPVPPRKAKIRLTRLLNGEKILLREGEPMPTDLAGGFTAEPCRAWVYDYLGLLAVPAKTEKRRVVVMPRAVEPEILPDVGKFLAKAWLPKAGGGYAENHEIRPYRPGDSLNQVHWKLSAKTGQLMLREPMEPRRERMLVTVDVKNDPAALDRDMSRLLWVGRFLLERELAFELAALTGEGLQNFRIESRETLSSAVEALLCAASAEGSVRDRQLTASWRYDIGGQSDET